MPRTSCIIKVCSNNYYILMKWTEGMSSTLAPHSCVCWTLDTISAVRDSCSSKDLKEENRRIEWIKLVSKVTSCYLIHQWKKSPHSKLILLELMPYTANDRGLSMCELTEKCTEFFAHVTIETICVRYVSLEGKLFECQYKAVSATDVLE